ncbi:NUDIX hydrolase [Pseudonocardia alni]|uniref:NUDIX hydrolase n=1 Tax=Pseudonocardia alni TaxID=33907 RepID=UPI00340814C8
MVNTPKHSVSVAGVVVDESGSVLVIQRQDNGHWEPPGGILELGESPIEGAKREVLEETGLEVEVDFLSGIYKNMSRGVVAIVFRAHQVGGSLRTSSESRRVEWRNVDEIENQMDPAYSIRIKDALAAGRPTVRIHDGEQLIVADPMNGDDFAESEYAEEADLQVEAFRFDASLDQLDGAVAALDEIYSQGNRHWEFLHQINDENLLQRNGLVARSPVVLELQDLIGYEIRIHGVSPANAVLMTRSHGDSRPAWPPPIEEKSPDVYALWSHLASRVSHPNSIARLEDLLFEARVGNRRERARRAIESYRAVFDASERDGTCAESILRAWELSRRVGDAVLEGELREMILNAAELEIANQGRAGLALPLLKAAGRWPRGAPRKDPRSYSPEQDERVDLILNRAFEALDARFASALVNVMKPRLRAGEAVLDLRRREVSAHRAEAHQASGFVKQVKLEEAVKIAKRYDLNDLAAEMIVEMQQIPRSELKMMSFSAPLQIPIDLRERMLNAYVETADWADGINAFLNSPPPTGDLDWLRQSARDSMRRSPWRLCSDRAL